MAPISPSIPPTWLLECLHRLIESAMQSMNDMHLILRVKMSKGDGTKMATSVLIYTGYILRILHAIYVF